MLPPTPRPNRHRRWRRLAARLILAVSFAVGSVAPWAAPSDEEARAIIAALEAALHDDADVEAMVVLLEGVPPEVIREWLLFELGHTFDCEAPTWIVALQAALRRSTTEEVVLLLAQILARADAAFYDCILLRADRDLALDDAERYEVLLAGLRASGILDAPDGLAADEAFVRQVLDDVLRPVPPRLDSDRPFLNPLERERPMSES